MPRRRAAHAQADYAQLLRAYHAIWDNVRTVMRPDGSVEFEPARDQPVSALASEADATDDRRIVL